MKLIFQSIQYHRNGICGAPFHAVLFRDPDEGEMLGVVFEDPHHVAVFNVGKLALGNIACGVNSWRGDHYEPYLRAALPKETETESGDSFDVHSWLAQRRQIAIVWQIEDVQSLRPDLGDDESWQVLQACDRYHDAGIGINWDVLRITAEELFPEEPDEDEEEEEDENEEETNETSEVPERRPS